MFFYFFRKNLTKKFEKSYIFYIFLVWNKKVYVLGVPGVTTIQKIYLCTMQFFKNMVISVDNCGLIHKKGFKKIFPKNLFFKYTFWFGMKKVYALGVPGVPTI